MVPVVLDTDIGSDIDDTWALAMLLGCPELDLRLVTTVSGDTIYRAAVAAGILVAGGRADVPIAIGIAGGGVSGTPQARFASAVDLAVYPGGVRNDAVAAIVETVMASPQPVTLVSIGPATNVAAALAAEPAMTSNARFVGMHGSLRIGYRNSPSPVAEYNVKTDVAAFRVVMDASWEITITPLDTCGSVILSGDRYRELRSAETPLLDALLRNYREWLDAAGRPDLYEQRSTTLFDTVAVYLAYSEELLEVETLRVGLADDGTMRIDDEGRPLRAATRWLDADGFTRHLAARLTSSRQA